MALNRPIAHYKTVEDFKGYAKRKYTFSEAQWAGFVVAIKNTNNYYKENLKEYIPLLKRYLGI